MKVPKTISTDKGKPNTAVLVTTSCALPGAAASGEITVSPTPITGGIRVGYAAGPVEETAAYLTQARNRLK